MFLGGGRNGCDGSRLPRVDAIGQTEIPNGLKICPAGFLVDKPLTVTVTPPTGVVTTVILPEDWNTRSAYVFPLVSGAPLGRYRVAVRQDSLRAATEFTARPASLPSIWLNPRFVQRGAGVHLYLGGFPPRKPALLHLYRGDSESMQYRTSFTVSVDANGEAHAVIESILDEPSVYYAVISPLVYHQVDYLDDYFTVTG